MTDLRSINRSTTNNPNDSLFVNDAFIRGDSANKQSGPLIWKEDRIEQYAQLFQGGKFSKSCDVEVAGIPVAHHLNIGIPTRTDAAASEQMRHAKRPLLDRDALLVSTRAMRRNKLADCQKK